MNGTKRSIALIMLMFASFLVSTALACGGSSDEKDKATATDSVSNTPTAGAQTPSKTAAETPQATSAEATLSLEATEFKITGVAEGAIPSISPGQIEVDLKNTGSVTHEVVFIKTDTDPGSLPMDGTKVDEDAAGTVAGEIEDLVAGASDSTSLDLTAGKYVLICNIPGHYQQGMYAPLIVQ